jgi:hypothetical protein
MTVTFPDGRRIELRYPRRIAAGVPSIRTTASVAWPLRAEPLRCCGRSLTITYRRIDEVYGDMEPIRTYQGIEGDAIPYFDGAGWSSAFDILVFQFAPWLVEVHDKREPGDFEGVMSEAERTIWARSLGGVVDDYGYLVLHARPPLRVETFANALVYLPAQGGVAIELADGYCGFPESDSAAPRHTGGGASWCDPTTGLHVNVAGDGALVDALADELQLRALTAGFATAAADFAEGA